MSEDAVYGGDFSDWGDVKGNFGGGNQMIPNMPDAVYLAAYETPDYDGFATVVYRLGQRCYVVEGSHCSCYGLEGQWEPTEYENADELIAALDKRGDESYWAPVVERIKAERSNA